MGLFIGDAQHTHNIQLVALYCSKVLGKKPLALRVMKRIKIMEEELVSLSFYLYSSTRVPVEGRLSL